MIYKLATMYYQAAIFSCTFSPRNTEIRLWLFPKSEYDYEYKESPKIRVIFPVLDKGKKDRDDWDEIREKLVNMGTDIYNQIKSAFEDEDRQVKPFPYCQGDWILYLDF